MPAEMSILTIRVPRENENTPEQAVQLFAALSQGLHTPNAIQRLFGHQPSWISIELVLQNSQVSFQLAFPPEIETYVHSQVLAAYPEASFAHEPNRLEEWTGPHIPGKFHLERPSFFPLKDYTEFRETDPLLSILAVLSKGKAGDTAIMQFLISEAPSNIQSSAYSYLHPSSSNPKMRAPTPDGKRIIENKLTQPLLAVELRLAANNKHLFRDLQQSLAVFNRPDGNSYAPSHVWPWKKTALWNAIKNRESALGTFESQDALNVKELASFWHLPNARTKVPNLSWAAGGGYAEAPENLPVSLVGTENKEHINFFATTTFQNRPANFGLKLTDRLRHMYALGKSGSGKSTLLENMAIDDMKKGRGLAFIDPHGTSAEALLNYIPASRIQDVVYFNPADQQFPIQLNILEVKNPDQAELVASGVVSIFHKLYGTSWGPRLEYILRNTLLTLTQVRGSTLADVVKMLTDYDFRRQIYRKLNNPQLLGFWQNEFDRLDERNRTEQTSSILNKVGRFVQSPMINSIISSPRSTIDLDEIMNTRKILIANISQGRLGEENASLLGALLITKLQQAAMNRVEHTPEHYPEFFLYVDEFQNFATDSFLKILSEARKYKLGIILANQYIDQIPDQIQKAIFGNVGTVLSFVLGANDARAMSAEFGGVFTPEALTNLQKHEVALRMTIDQASTRPFLARTLPPPKSSNMNKEKVLRSSRQRWAKEKKPAQPEPVSSSESPAAGATDQTGQ